MTPDKSERLLSLEHNIMIAACILRDRSLDPRFNYFEALGEALDALFERVDEYDKEKRRDYDR